jgi:hypothetical protein
MTGVGASAGKVQPVAYGSHWRRLSHGGGKDCSSSLVDEIVREGTRRMLAGALQAEVDAYIAQFAECDESGHRLMVRNGSQQPQAGADQCQRGGGDRTAGQRQTHCPVTGERERFSSAILLSWARKTPKITEVLPLFYLHRLSSGDFVPALGQFLSSAAGLSTAVITRLTETWKAGQPEPALSPDKAEPRYWPRDGRGRFRKNRSSTGLS